MNQFDRKGTAVKICLGRSVRRWESKVTFTKQKNQGKALEAASGTVTVLNPSRISAFLFKHEFDNGGDNRCVSTRRPV